jgi:hypothetical protein
MCESPRHILPFCPRSSATEGGDGILILTSHLHEGAVVLSGQKYVLRTDVMYRADQ